MYIKFWGTRGSIPTPLSSDSLKEKIRLALEGAAGLDLSDEVVVDRYLDRLPLSIRGTIGGNTACVEVRSGEQLLIIDAGSGLRLLGLDLLARGFAAGGQHADFLITHTHWDHIQGFPFFVPAFIPNNHFTFYSPFADLQSRLEQQQDQVFFPVDTDYMSATFSFRQLAEDEWGTIGRFRVRPMRLSHPGVTYAYRIEDGNSVIVFASDGEYKHLDRQSTEAFIEFFHDADLLVFDAQYGLSEALDKSDWGHSSAVMGAELAYRAGVKCLALFHHDPVSPDDKILEAQVEAEAYLRHAHNSSQRCQIRTAYDGLTMDI